MIAKWIGIAVLLHLVQPSAAVAEDRAPSVSVVGEAEEQARPDLAYIVLDIVADRPNANDAATENARVANVVVDGLKGSGVDPKDITTIGLSLTPVMTEQHDPKTNQYIKSVLTGYHAANVIRVRVRDIERVGAFIAASAQNGALYRGVSFDVSDRETREDALRVKAASNAMHRAALYAEGAGVKLGALREINASESRRLPYNEMPMARALAAAPASAPVEPGLISLVETVNATWDLKAP